MNVIVSSTSLYPLYIQVTILFCYPLSPYHPHCHCLNSGHHYLLQESLQFVIIVRILLGIVVILGILEELKIRKIPVCHGFT